MTFNITRMAWVWVAAALVIGAFIGRGGGLDALAQATPGVTETAVPPTSTAPAPTVAPTVPAGDNVGGQPAPAGGVAADSRLVIRVVERAITDTEIDLDPQGDSIGDLIAFGNPVYDEQNQAQVGQSQGSCVRVVPGQLYECAWTTILPDGQITVQGPFADAGNTVLAITGGTGAYAGASGEMSLAARNAEGTEYDFVFSIIRASLAA